MRRAVICPVSGCCFIDESAVGLDVSEVTLLSLSILDPPHSTKTMSASDEALAKQLQAEFDAEAAAAAVSKGGPKSEETVVVSSEDEEQGSPKTGTKRASSSSQKDSKQAKASKTSAGSSAAASSPSKGKAKTAAAASSSSASTAKPQPKTTTIFIPVEATEESFFCLGVFTSKPAALKALRDEYLPLLSEAPWGGKPPSDIPGPNADLEARPYYVDDVPLFYGVFRKIVKGEITDNTVYVLQKVNGNYSDNPNDIEVYATKEEADRAMPSKKQKWGGPQVTEMELDFGGRSGGFGGEE